MKQRAFGRLLFASLRCLAWYGVGLLFALPLTATANCDKCPKPNVDVYDFAVTVPKPEDPKEAWSWGDLFGAAKTAGAEISKDQKCVAFYDGVVSAGQGLKVGRDVANVVPAGAIKNRDYLFTGSVERGNAGYHLDIALETACSRKTAVSASANFNATNDARAAGEQLAREKMRPLLAKIREFEREQRDADSRIAIGVVNGGAFTAVPAKRNAKRFETVPVTLSLTDCDGAPLRNRVIALVPKNKEWGAPSENGQFTAATATTDNAGKVTIGFKVGGKPGKAVARAYFHYLSPTGCGETVDTALAEIQVGGVEIYSGAFSTNDVVVETEYTRAIAGTIRWELDEYYAEGGWHEYTGTGSAHVNLSRTGCGPAAQFRDVPVEGRLKVYDDKHYEFLINLTGEGRQTRTCRRPELDKNLMWEENFIVEGDALSSADPCEETLPCLPPEVAQPVNAQAIAAGEASPAVAACDGESALPRAAELLTLKHARSGTCRNLVNRYRHEWQFKAGD